MEDVDHLFLSYSFFGKIWFGVYNWLSLTMVHPEHVAHHLLQKRPTATPHQPEYMYSKYNHHTENNTTNKG